MGVKPVDSRAFRLNGQYNLTRQVRLVTALYALDGVSGRPEFVGRAAGAQADADAQFYMESALLAEIFHRTQAPVTAIVAMPSARAAATIWRSIALPTPVRRTDWVVCIDLTSPWAGVSRLSAPHPASASSCQIVQKLMSGACSPATSKA